MFSMTGRGYQSFRSSSVSQFRDKLPSWVPDFSSDSLVGFRPAFSVSMASAIQKKRSSSRAMRRLSKSKLRVRRDLHRRTHRWYSRVFQSCWKPRNFNRKVDHHCTIDTARRVRHKKWKALVLQLQEAASRISSFDTQRSGSSRPRIVRGDLGNATSDLANSPTLGNIRCFQKSLLADEPLVGPVQVWCYKYRDLQLFKGRIVG